MQFQFPLKKNYRNLVDELKYELVVGMLVAIFNDK